MDVGIVKITQFLEGMHRVATVGEKGGSRRSFSFALFIRHMGSLYAKVRAFQPSARSRRDFLFREDIERVTPLVFMEAQADREVGFFAFLEAVFVEREGKETGFGVEGHREVKPVFGIGEGIRIQPAKGE